MPHLRSLFTSVIALGALITFADVRSQAAEITGAGSTAIYPVLAKWAEAYKAKTGTSINYQSIGSGGGIAQIKAKTVQFGATDKPLESAELVKEHLIQFPAIVIGIVPVVNLPGVDGGKLALDGTTLADIYLGKVTMWNDPEIAALNGGMTLPAQKISVVHRSDGSGTTFNFTDYLSKVSPDWKSKVGEGTAVNWPAGVGGKGNAGVAAYVQQIPGSIGYVEFAYAEENHMPSARMKNADGEVLAPTRDGFQAAAASADWAHAKDFLIILTNQPGKQSWPITGATWLLMRSDVNQAENKTVIDFATWFLTDAKAIEIANDLNYVALPTSTATVIEGYWKAELKI